MPHHGRVLELADRLLPLLRAGVPVAVATCIDVLGSAPHAVGTSMALAAGGPPIGAVSGGCAEAAALADCRAVLAGAPAMVRRSGVGAVEGDGPACGGEVDVLTHLVDAVAAAVLIPQLERAARGESAAVALVTGGPSTGSVGSEDGIPVPSSRLADAVRAAVRAAAGSGSIALDARTRLFVEVAAPTPRLLLIGATETAVAVSAAAAALGRAVTVCDVRADFAAAQRFPAARQVVVGLPHEVVASFAPGAEDAVVLLSHDEDLDVLALAAALESAAGYVGAQGSRATTARRLARLRDLGVDDATAGRLHAPIGLDLGARTPAETALSILAEVLAVGTASSAAPLRAGTGPIHAFPLRPAVAQ